MKGIIFIIVILLSAVASYGQCDKIKENEWKIEGFTNRYILKNVEFMPDKKIIIYYEKDGYWEEIYSDRMIPFDGYRTTMPNSDLKCDLIFYAKSGCRYAYGNGEEKPVEFKEKKDEKKWKVE
ncbi:MAG: hypothetical protein H6588_08610 [Flavobacteriales bacterium]|nr:hypothetical protein [Flavobacteriales bacterium]